MEVVNSLQFTISMNKEQYDEEPVLYCTRCLSLAIRRIDSSDTECYCNDCMSMDLAETDIHTWEKMYREMYGHDYITHKNK